MEQQQTDAKKQSLAYQDHILPGVSRTFAFTIPQLPDNLRQVVTNAYLLCRIADTIEDDAGLDLAQKTQFLEEFQQVVAGTQAASDLAQKLYPHLAVETLAAEKELIKNMDNVIPFTLSLNSDQRAALQRCVNVMTVGMHKFESKQSIQGLDTLKAMNDYCYYVAGIVGEMLTELFCDYSPTINARRDQLMQFAISFGQGLQMTNILKDQWDDRQRGVCWLPQEIFNQYGFDLTKLTQENRNEHFVKALHHLVGIAHTHLANALEYTLLIPRRETGIRKFCLWAIGLAIFTLRNIYRRPLFNHSTDVKITRRTVKIVVAMTELTCSKNTLLHWLFNLSTRGLPRQAIEISLATELKEGKV